MKTYDRYHLRRALAVLAAGLALGGMFATTSRADMYRIGTNYPPGTAGPYNSGGGVPARPYITSETVTSTNVMLCTYGMQGWYSVQSSPDMNTWTQVGNTVAATDFAWNFTVTNALGLNGNNNNFRLAVNNSFAGQGACSGCHGVVYTPWSSTAHARAYGDLVNSHQNNNPSCLLCHTVGYSQPTGYTDPTLTPNLENVGCESCHGPAGWHKNSDHSLILPAVSIDPSICGSCHQGFNPQYNEYVTSLHAQVNDDVKYGNDSGAFYTNTITLVLKGVPWTSYGYYVSTNATTGVVTTNPATGIINSTNVPGSGIDSGRDRQTSCGVCHSGAARMAMINDYNARLSGTTNALVLPTANDAGAWGPTCAICHDPHATYAYPVYTMVTNIIPGVSTNTGMSALGSQTLQLRNPTWSSNYFTMASQSDKRYDSSGKPYYMNTTFASMYDPNVNVCGQCHNTRGARWDGLAYGLLTNIMVGGPVTNLTYVDIYSYVTNIQVFTNVSTGIPYTNYYPYSYVSGRYATNVITMSTTNQAITVGLTTNVTGFSRAPHLSPQYNMLIGILQPDYLNTTNGKTVWTNSVLNNGIGIYATHSGIAPRTPYNTNQCTTCHVPSYAGPSGNVSGHTFQVDPNGCALGGCHNSTSHGTPGAPDYVDYAIENSNLVISVADLLNRWATSNGPALFPSTYNNYLQNSWEYTSPGSLASITNSGPSTSDQLLLPIAIQQARFDIYMVDSDGTFGAHNPTFIPLLIRDAETKVISQFKTAMFTANQAYGGPGSKITFTNLNPTVTACSWTFGDGGTSSSTALTVTHVYTNTTGSPYTVSLTATDANGTQTMTRNSFITIYPVPTPNYTYTTGTLTNTAPVNFTNTSAYANFGNWAFYSGTVTAANNVGGIASPMNIPQFFTFTNAGTYTVVFTASSPGGNAYMTNTITVQ